MKSAGAGVVLVHTYQNNIRGNVKENVFWKTLSSVVHNSVIYEYIYTKRISFCIFGITNGKKTAKNI